MTMSGRVALVLVGTTVLLSTLPTCAQAQSTITGALSFLLTNRSIPTGDFARDEAAARATLDTIATFLRSELTTLPVASAASGFTYRIDPSLGGVPVRSTTTFGSFLTERSVTAGTLQLSVATTYQAASFDRIDGRALRDGTLRATASRLTSDPTPFDVETLTMRIHTDAVTVAANLGITDQLEIAAALPLQRLTLTGERIDTYRGAQLLQAVVSATASGPGDLVLRTKLNVLRRAGSGLAIGAEARLPTGNAANLLGSDQATLMPRLIWSIESAHIAVDSNVGYLFNRTSDEIDYRAAVTSAGSQRLTLVGEVAGRRLNSAGHLVDVTTPHPFLAGIETIRLSAVPQETNRVIANAGIKWNAWRTWLVTASLSRSLTTSGLTAPWTSTAGVEYAFGE
jgi:hypothetical protein